VDEAVEPPKKARGDHQIPHKIGVAGPRVLHHRTIVKSMIADRSKGSSDRAGPPDPLRQNVQVAPTLVGHAKTSIRAEKNQTYKIKYE
jgi:hypothetical protein